MLAFSGFSQIINFLKRQILAKGGTLPKEKEVEEVINSNKMPKINNNKRNE